MPDILGTLKTPRLATAPSAPVVGQQYYNTSDNTLYWWNGTVWIPGNRQALSAIGPQIDDFNLAINNGWYCAIPATINGPEPGSGWWALEVMNILGTNSCRQIAHKHNELTSYMRYQSSGNWSAWAQYTDGYGAPLLPQRIQELAQYITDWNSVYQNGWYMGANIANQPVADGQWYIGEVISHNNIWTTQRAWAFTQGAGSPIYERRNSGGTWTAWKQVTSEDRIAAVAIQKTDCNACLDSGWYCLNGPTNSPIGVANNQGYVSVIVWQANAYIEQTWYTLGASEIYIRQMSNGVWSPWVKTYPAAASTDLSFDGDWVAGTYQEGDTVVKDGVVFLCVGGPTSVAPDATLWGGLGPLPAVVNGKWIKGVGGAAVWSDINYSDIIGTPAPPSASPVIDRTTSTVDVTNSTVEQSIYTKVIPGGTMGIDKMLRLNILGDFLYNAASNNLIIKIKFGGSIIWQNTYNNSGTGTDRRPFKLDLDISNLGVANSQYMVGSFLASYNDNTSGNPNVGLGLWDVRNQRVYGGIIGSNGLLAINTAVDQTLDVTAQWSAAGTTLSFRKRYAALELI